MPAPDEQPVDRRRFFREGFRELLKPLAQAIEPIEDVLKQLTDLDLPSSPASRIPPGVWLRPPGSLAEKPFFETCSHCGECARVCPAQCIKIDPTGQTARGLPYIDADVMPCVLCDGLQCTHACPTGSILPIPLVEVDMGTAVWRPDVCVRKDGQDCTICIDRCPVGSMALELVGNDVVVHPEGCAGCGVCQYYCPTDPKSIVVIPKAARER